MRMCMWRYKESTHESYEENRAPRRCGSYCLQACSSCGTMWISHLLSFKLTLSCLPHFCACKFLHEGPLATPAVGAIPHFCDPASLDKSVDILFTSHKSRVLPLRIQKFLRQSSTLMVLPESLSSLQTEAMTPEAVYSIVRMLMA